MVLTADSGVSPFSVAALPVIIFGNGVFERLASEIEARGGRALIVTGGRSFTGSHHWQALSDRLKQRGLIYHQVSIAGEPAPEQVDDVVQSFSPDTFSVVVGIGGGSALDAAKAIAGLLQCQRPVTDFLEGVGAPEQYPGTALPLIAVPTTAGTGSELTRNAVITRHGEGGFKKSFRHDALLASLALVDPVLLETCPPSVMLGNALDAFTQLLESYLSTRASVFTDALALDGFRAFSLGFQPVADQPVRDYGQLAYAAMLSGICLTQAGLGSVHGFASPLGALFPIPHGMACGTMLAVCTDMNRALLREQPDSQTLLARYDNVARILHPGGKGDNESIDLVETLYEWTAQCQVPRLASFGVLDDDIHRIVADSRGSSMKTNPVALTDEQLESLLRQRL